MSSTKTTTREFDQAALDTFETMTELTNVNGDGDMVLAYLNGCRHSVDANMRSYRRTSDTWFLDRARGTEHGICMYLGYRERMRDLLFRLRAERGKRAAM
jgi:hypothetical protein